jgi:hypothetical protein
MSDYPRGDYPTSMSAFKLTTTVPGPSGHEHSASYTHEWTPDSSIPDSFAWRFKVYVEIDGIGGGDDHWMNLHTMHVGLPTLQAAVDFLSQHWVPTSDHAYISITNAAGVIWKKPQIVFNDQPSRGEVGDRGWSTHHESIIRPWADQFWTTYEDAGDGEWVEVVA